MSSQNQGPPGGQASPPTETIARKQKSSVGPYIVVAAVIIVVAIAGIGYEAGWFSSKSSTTTPAGKACVAYTGQTVNVAGSSFVAPLQDEWETVYTANTLDYDSVGSGTGISDLSTFATDVAASDAPISYAQNHTDFTAANDAQLYLTVPDAAGGAAVIYNLAGTWHSPLNFSAAVLAGIFTGTITSWSASAIQTLNPSDTLPNSPIVVVHRSDGSGTSYMFQQFLQWDSGGAWNLNYSTTWLGPSGLTGEIAAKGSSGVTQAVESTSGAISYVDLEYALSNGVGFGAVENVEGKFVLPSLNSISASLSAKTSEAAFTLPAGSGNWSTVNLLNAPTASGYPIASFTYLMFYSHPEAAFPSSSSMTQALAESIANYLNWTQSSAAGGGQTYSSALYYVPLPSFVTSWDEQTIGLMTWGSTAVTPCEPGTGPTPNAY